MSECEAMPVMLPATIPVPIPVESVQIEDQIIAVPTTQEIVPDNPVVSKILMSSVQYQEITKSIASLSAECRMFFTADGIQTRFVDNANVAMLQMEYKGSGFEVFKTTGTHEIGIDITIWKTFSKMVKKGNLVLLEVTQHTKKISEEDQKKNPEKEPEYFYEYTLSCNGNVQTVKGLDVNTIRKKPNLPTIDLPTKINLFTSDLIETITSAKAVSDKVYLIVNESGFSAMAEGTTSKLNKQISITGRTGPGARSLFSLDYLVDFARAIQNKKEIVTVHLGNDHPMMIEFSDDIREIKFLLAPRIEAD